MRPVKIRNAEIVAAQIEEEIHAKPEGRYYHRIHLILLLARGMTCEAVANLYSRPLRMVQRWAKELNDGGLDALKDESRSGRPTRLTARQIAELEDDLKSGPQSFSFSQGFWDGPLLAYHIEAKYGVKLSVRQCQRIFRKLGYTLLRPQTQPEGSMVDAREAFKKLFEVVDGPRTEVWFGDGFISNCTPQPRACGRPRAVSPR